MSLFWHVSCYLHIRELTLILTWVRARETRSELCYSRLQSFSCPAPRTTFLLSLTVCDSKAMYRLYLLKGDLRDIKG